MSKNPQATSEAAESTASAESHKSAGKGRPTPKRRESEALNRRPLIAGDRAEAKRRARAEREKARIGMAAGDERYLPAKERGPQKRFVRDYVDGRWSLGEFMLPVMIVVIVLTFVPSTVVIAAYTFGLWAFVAALIVDSLLISRKAKRLAAERFGAENVERGLGLYAAMRALQMRGMRIPKPQVKRGGFDPNQR